MEQTTISIKELKQAINQILDNASQNNDSLKITITVDDLFKFGEKMNKAIVDARLKETVQKIKKEGAVWIVKRFSGASEMN